jgi:hypothetical protein
MSWLARVSTPGRRRRRGRGVGKVARWGRSTAAVTGGDSESRDKELGSGTGKRFFAVGLLLLAALDVPALHPT